MAHPLVLAAPGRPLLALGAGLRLSALAAALLANGAAQAQLSNPGLTQNGILFTAVDNVGDPVSITIDLAFVLTDFDPRGEVSTVLPGGDGSFGPRGALLAEGTTAVWNFRDNTLTVNGTDVPGDYRWSSQFGIFAANAQASETRYAIVGMSTGNFPEFFLTSGNPTPTQLAQQGIGQTQNLGVSAGWYGKISTRGAWAGVPGNGAQVGGPVKGSYAMLNNTSDLQGWPLGGGNLGSQGNWAGNLRWSALVAEGVASELRFLTAADAQTIDELGTFSYSNGVLTWQSTQPIPEPGAWLLAALGAGLLLHWKRRRNVQTPANAGAPALPSAHAPAQPPGLAFTVAA
jgi:hypothetical protein